MKFKDDFDTNSRRRHRPHSSHSQTPYLGTNALQGVPLQCQFCSGQTFRRSTLRADDLYQMFLMRYPVRCLRCSQRQMVSFAVAGISLSSKIKPRRIVRNTAAAWVEPTSESATPTPAQQETTHNP
jgi:hypothetical protein